MDNGVSYVDLLNETSFTGDSVNINNLVAQTAQISSLSGTTLTYINADLNFIDNIGITGHTLNYNDGFINSLQGNTVNYSIGMIDSLDGITLNYKLAQVDTIISNGITGTTARFNTISATGFSGTTAFIDMYSGSSINLTNGLSTPSIIGLTATIFGLTGNTAVFRGGITGTEITMNTMNGTTANMTTANITTANITNLNISGVSFANINAGSANITAITGATSTYNVMYTGNLTLDSSTWGITAGINLKNVYTAGKTTWDKHYVNSGDGVIVHDNEILGFGGVGAIRSFRSGKKENLQINTFGITGATGYFNTLGAQTVNTTDMNSVAVFTDVVNCASVGATGDIISSTTISANNLEATQRVLGSWIEAQNYYMTGITFSPNKLLMTSEDNYAMSSTLGQSDIVTIGTAQTVSGNKIFSGGVTFSNSVRIGSTYTLEFGAGTASKEVNAGKIGYATYTTGALDIVGGGSGVGNRLIRMWECLGIGTAPSTSYSLITGSGITSAGNIVGTNGVQAISTSNAQLLTTISSLVAYKDYDITCPSSGGLNFRDRGNAFSIKLQFDTSGNVNIPTGTFKVTNGITSANLITGGITATSLSLTNSTSGYVATALNYYEELNTTHTFSGIWASNQTVNARYTRIGRSVTFSLERVYTTANTASIAKATGGVATRFRPYVKQWYRMIIYDNNTAQTGLLSVDTNGDIWIGKGDNQGNYPTGTNNCGWENLSMVWTV